jgi:hypothetical protein
LCGFASGTFEYVIADGGTGAGYAIKDAVERDLRAYGVAVLARFDQLLGFAQSRGVNENDVLLLRTGVEEVAGYCGRILLFVAGALPR